MYRRAVLLSYPEGEYRVLNASTGTYVQNGITLVCPRIAVDYSLTTIATRWYNEVEVIKKMLHDKESE